MKKKNSEMLLVLMVILTSNLFAQNVGINSTGNAPNSSAGLDVDFVNKGMLAPRVADTNAIVSPAEALIIYDLSSHCYRYRTNVKWTGCIGETVAQPPLSSLVTTLNFIPILKYCEWTNPNNGHTYAMYKSNPLVPIPYLDAEATAVTLGGYLVTITTLAEANLICNAPCNNGSVGLLTGYHSTGCVGASTTWTNGEPWSGSIPGMSFGGFDCWGGGQQFIFVSGFYGACAYGDHTDGVGVDQTNISGGFIIEFD